MVRSFYNYCLFVCLLFVVVVVVIVVNGWLAHYMLNCIYHVRGVQRIHTTCYVYMLAICFNVNIFMRWCIVVAAAAVVFYSRILFAILFNNNDFSFRSSLSHLFSHLMFIVLDWMVVNSDLRVCYHQAFG